MIIGIIVDICTRLSALRSCMLGMPGIFEAEHKCDSNYRKERSQRIIIYWK
jgi:hypothetical protein